jgi:GntR family transcriptional repressor for pyruvate dehydrogenase complex
MAVTDDAVNKIRELIIAGDLQPGDRLPQESALADQLGKLYARSCPDP